MVSDRNDVDSCCLTASLELVTFRLLAPFRDDSRWLRGDVRELLYFLRWACEVGSAEVMLLIAALVLSMGIRLCILLWGRKDFISFFMKFIS